MVEAWMTAHGLFPGSIYSEDLKVLIFKVARATVAIYSTENVALSMVSNENETREVFDGICTKANIFLYLDGAHIPKVARAWPSMFPNSARYLKDLAEMGSQDQCLCQVIYCLGIQGW
jgi:hypothetical protein